MPVSVEVRDDRFHEVVETRADLECLASGFQFLEGPAWHPIERHLTFSDIPADRLYRWSPAEGVSVSREPSHMANGNTFDRQGRLLTCEHATSRVTRTERDGTVSMLASHFAGRELNSPNDIVVKSDGSIYFSDPNFGRRPTRVGVPRPQQQPCQGVYRLNPGSLQLARVADDFENPNGLCFSLDEQQLFVNDSPRGQIRVFDVQPDGGLTGGRVWAEVNGAGPGVPDGMKVDTAGRLWCCGPGGIHIFDMDAVCLGVIGLPAQTANFTWGDDDLLGLYITASTSLYRLRVCVPGRKLF